MMKLRESARLEEGQHPGISLASEEPNAGVPGTDIPLRTVLRTLREFSGFPERRVSGEIFKANAKEYGLRLQVASRRGAQEVVVFAPDVNMLMHRGAVELTALTDPLLAAAALYGADPNRAELLVRQVLKDASTDARSVAEAYNLWGQLLLTRWRNKPQPPARAVLDEAIEKFSKAIERDPTFATGFASLGLAHREATEFWRRQRDDDRGRRHRELAEKAFRTAITVDSHLALGHYGLGLVIRDRCVTPSAHCCDAVNAGAAARALAEATRLTPGVGERWFELARTRAWSSPSDVDGAVEAFGVALAVAPTPMHFCSMIAALRLARNEGCLAPATGHGGDSPESVYRNAVRMLRAKARVLGRLQREKDATRRSTLEVVRQHAAVDQCRYKVPPAADVWNERTVARALTTGREAFCARAQPAEAELVGVVCGISPLQQTCAPALAPTTQ